MWLIKQERDQERYKWGKMGYRKEHEESGKIKSQKDELKRIGRKQREREREEAGEFGRLFPRPGKYEKRVKEKESKNWSS